LQMFSLRREQGRLKELEPLVKYFLTQHKETAAWRPGLAVIYAELGRSQDARDQFEQLARFDFADIPRDSLWMATMTYLADVCTFSTIGRVLPRCTNYSCRMRISTP